METADNSAEAPIAATAAAPATGLTAGLIGRGIQDSRSPAMHESEGRRIGLPYRYELIDFDARGFGDDDLDDVISDLEARGFAGVNVTHPFKQAVLSRLTRLSPEAADIGAVNTIVFERGERIGHNTDCWGFAESFRQAMSSASVDSIVLLGAGGAGKAVAQALLDQLATSRLAIHDVVAERAVTLAATLRQRFGAADIAAVRDLPSAILSADGIVNATPVGMSKYPGSPVGNDCLRPDLWVADIVYFPKETELLATARRRGALTLSGVGMAVHQAAKAFELFTGSSADAEHMAQQLE